MNTEDSEFARIEREIKTRALPDSIHHTDTSEPLMYIQGWNDCRAAMLAEQQAQREPLTNEQICDIWSWSMTAKAERTASTQQHAFARAIEAAHGIKENT